MSSSKTKFNAYFVISLALNVMDDYGNTPLHWAAEKNQVESVKFLLSQGANPNLRNRNMMAPLHIAVQGMYNEVIKVSLLAFLEQEPESTPDSLPVSEWLTSSAMLWQMKHNNYVYFSSNEVVVMVTRQRNDGHEAE